MDGPLLRLLFVLVCAGTTMVVGFCSGGVIFSAGVMADQLVGAFMGALLGVIVGSFVGLNGNQRWSGKRRFRFALGSILAAGVAVGIVVILDKKGLW